MARKKETIYMPLDRNAAAHMVTELGDLYRRVREREAAFKASVEALRKGFHEETSESRRRIEALYRGLALYAEKNRGELTDGGKAQSVEFPSGTMGWRKTPPSVVIAGAAAVVIKALKALGLGRFIRTKEEIDKKTLLKEPEVAVTVPGVSIAQSEIFFVKPASAEGEVSEEVLKKLKGKREKAA